MKQFQIRRLEVLAEHMKKVKAKHLTMMDVFNDNECDSPACVLGYASQVKAFRRAGLKFIPGDKRSAATVEYKGEQTEMAGALFFGLEEYEGFNFFGYSGRAYGTDRPTPKQVARALLDRARRERRAKA